MDFYISQYGKKYINIYITKEIPDHPVIVNKG